MENTDLQHEVELASLRQRLFATLIDGAILVTCSKFAKALLTTAGGGDIKLMYLMLPLLYLPAVWLFAVMPMKSGQSPGKKIMKIKVVDERNTEREGPDFLTCLGREFLGKFISGLSIIGYPMALLNADRKALHDWCFETRVVKVKAL